MPEQSYSIATLAGLTPRQAWASFISRHENPSDFPLIDSSFRHPWMLPKEDFEKVSAIRFTTAYGDYERTVRQEFDAFKRSHRVELKERLISFGNVCFYCKCGFTFDRVNPLRVRTWDHVVPICRGGKNEIENLVPCCLHCNMKKHTKTKEEFMASFSL